MSAAVLKPNSNLRFPPPVPETHSVALALGDDQDIAERIAASKSNRRIG